MGIITAILSLLIASQAHAANTYNFYDYSGNQNQIRVHPSGQSQWLEIPGLNLISLKSMSMRFQGLKFYESDTFKKNPDDDSAIGNIFSKIRLVVRNNAHPEFDRALIMFRAMAERTLDSTSAPIGVDQFCPWTSDALLIIKMAADERGNSPTMTFCLVLENRGTLN